MSAQGTLLLGAGGIYKKGSSSITRMDYPHVKIESVWNKHNRRDSNASQPGRNIDFDVGLPIENWTGVSDFS